MALTFLAVHAHPDDEASSTGGLFRVLADQRVRTVLVTCTRGEFGDAPGRHQARRRGPRRRRRRGDRDSTSSTRPSRSSASAVRCASAIATRA